MPVAMLQTQTTSRWSLGPQKRRCAGTVCSQRNGRKPLNVSALQIDRRSAFEAAWQRQQEKEEQQQRWSTDIAEGKIIEIQDSDELEVVLELAGSALVIMFLYSRQCGVCKDAGKRFEQLRTEAHRGQARAVFVRHDIETAYGDKSNLSREHNVRAVPCFLFFDGGAVVRRLSLRDIRRLTGPTPYVQAALAEDVRKLKSTFLEVLLSRAPSARS